LQVELVIGITALTDPKSAPAGNHTPPFPCFAGWPVRSIRQTALPAKAALGTAGLAQRAIGNKKGFSTRPTRSARRENFNVGVQIS